jgi:hypothetical protein
VLCYLGRLPPTNSAAWMLCRPATWLFLLYRRLAYRRLAAQVARDIGDYVRSGQSVQAVVGVGGSPSCGVRTTLDLKAVLDAIIGCDPTKLNTDDFNRRVIAGHARAGQGMFIAALRRQLRRRGLEGPVRRTRPHRRDH